MVNQEKILFNSQTLILKVLYYEVGILLVRPTSGLKF